MTGPAPQAALEAAHLYRYADHARHEAGGGLLLRRDIHTLFDAGLITVDNGTVRIHPSLGDFPAYRILDGSALLCRTGPAEDRWLAAHHRQSVQHWPCLQPVGVNPTRPSAGSENFYP